VFVDTPCVIYRKLSHVEYPSDCTCQSCLKQQGKANSSNADVRRTILNFVRQLLALVERSWSFRPVYTLTSPYCALQLTDSVQEVKRKRPIFNSQLGRLIRLHRHVHTCCRANPPFYPVYTEGAFFPALSADIPRSFLPISSRAEIWNVRNFIYMSP
jgi:hypothetical protein